MEQKINTRGQECESVESVLNEFTESERKSTNAPRFTNSNMFLWCPRSC